LKAFVIVGYYPPISESCFVESEKCASKWPVKISHSKCVLCAKGGKGMKEKKTVSDHAGMAHITFQLS